MSLLKMTSRSFPTKSFLYADLTQELMDMFNSMPEDWQEKVKNQGYYMVFCDHGYIFIPKNGTQQETVLWRFKGLSKEKIESNPSKMTITEMNDITWIKEKS